MLGEKKIDLEPCWSSSWTISLEGLLEVQAEGWEQRVLDEML